MLIAGLAAVVSFSLSVGSVNIPLERIMGLLTHDQTGIDHSIIYDIRLPRIILGFAVGGSLSLAGVILQGMFRNPLVEPYTLGISGGAALGVALNIVLGWAMINRWSFPLAGCLGSAVVIVFLYFSTLGQGRVNLQNLLLNGVMISFISSSAVMLLMSLTSSTNLQGIVFWIMGSLGETDPMLIQIMLWGSLLLLMVSCFFALHLNVLVLSEEEAQQLGIPVERTKKILFLLSALLTGLCVSVAGIIGFVGLVVPHFVRRLVGWDHRILLVAAFLAGGIFLIFCDTLARTIIAPLELPVGVITGIAGGSIFIYTLIRREAGHA
jgi:iron complex transport system permease protein